MENVENSTTVYVSLVDAVLLTLTPPSQGYEGYDEYSSYNNNEYNNSYNSNNRQEQGDWSQDHGPDDRPRGGAGGSSKKRMVPSEPSPHVIFLGLDHDFTEADVCRLPCS